MKPFRQVVLLIASLSLALICLPVDANQQKKIRQIWLRTRAGPILAGDLVKMDVDTVDFTVKGILQSVPCDDLIGVMLVPPGVRPPPTPEPIIYPMSADLRPKILHRNKATYTYKAREEKIQGAVILQVVFHESGRITDIKPIRELSHGLTEQAIGTAYMIRFIPAMKDGKPVSVRGSLEFNFNLY
jgi:Gram-negative bacterial TonB protein C-terminal